MTYEPKSFDHLIGLDGFSEDMLRNHLTLYQGYVTNTNKLLELTGELVKADKVATPEFAEIGRRLGWEWNGMRLHELYFGNLSKSSTQLSADSPLAQKINQGFGSLENWTKEFKGIAALRGIGWAVLYYDQANDRLINVWINEHNANHLAGCVPILVLDVFEHAFMLDYGIKRADYIAAFFKAINWATAGERLGLIVK
jgi:Fe-Mn family superoxide dismutase